MSPSLSLLIEQLRKLETQLPVSITCTDNNFILMEKQLPQAAISPISSAEHTTTANQLLADARLLREQLAEESTEANHKLTEAVLAMVMYTEKVENAGRLLVLADSCVGRIRSRMRARGIPIYPPPAASNAVTVSDVNRVFVQGQLIRL